MQNMIVPAKPVLPPDEVDVFGGEVGDGADAAIEGGRADTVRRGGVEQLRLAEADASVDGQALVDTHRPEDAAGPEPPMVQTFT